MSVADVHCVPAYAFDNPEEIRRLEAAGEEVVVRIREARPVDPPESRERA